MKNNSPLDVVELYGSYLKEANISKILDLYLDDAEIIPDLSASLRGISKIGEFYKNTFSNSIIKGDLKILHHYSSGNISIVRCEEPGDILSISTGIIEKSYFREIFILEFMNFSWKIKMYMFSQNKEQRVG